MSEELLQRNLLQNPEKIGKWEFYNIGATTVKALKEHGIIRNVDYGIIEGKKVDALIVKTKNVVAIIEYKKPSQFKSEDQKNKAIKQEIEVAKALGAKIIIATDTKDTVWVNVLTGKRINDENGKEVKTAFDPKNDKIADLIEEINYSINEKNNNLKPRELVNPTDLAKQIWQDVWSVSGATPENCLYTFVELFIFKYLSDLNVLKGIYNFDTLIENFKTNPSEDILENYASVIRPKIKELFPASLIDKTTIINGTIFVSKDQKAVRGYSTVFKKVLDKFSKYPKLEHIDYDFKSQLFESFLKESISKKNWGQFFTPLKVVRAIVEMAKDDIKEGVKICDPACGVGKFLLEPIKTKLGYFYRVEKNEIYPKITICGFDKGFDRDEQKTIILAKANMLIYFSDLIKENSGLTKNFAQLFNDSFILKTNSILGTLSEPVKEEYDLILTNPPYVTSGSSNLKEEIKKDGALVNHYRINAMGVEGLFMEWIIRALKPNGKAYIIVPDGILNRQNDKHLRKFILDECYLNAIVSLPIKTFFATPKKTYILVITKKAERTSIQKEPVFTYLVSEIGETRDVNRFEIERNDLQEATALYSFFKGNKSNFDKINTDERCKIQPIDKFIPEEHWSVDRWWTKEEKIKIGVVEEEKTIDLNSFGELIKAASETLDEFSSHIKEIAEEKKKIEFRKIFLKDDNYFHLFIGKRVTKKDIVSAAGDIPIYSANVFNPVGYHNKSNITNFDNNFVLWGIDSDFEFNYIKKNKPFATTDHCGSIRVLNDNVLPEYLMIQLEAIKHQYGFDRGLRSSLKNMKKISVKLPFTVDGKIDIKEQQRTVEKYQVIRELKKQVKEYKQKIRESAPSIETNCNYKKVKVKDIFDFPSTNSKITKSFCMKHKGTIPVYASSKTGTSVLGYIQDGIKGVKYYQNCLSWNRNGSVGYVFVRNHKFTTNEDHRTMIVKNTFRKSLDLEYLRTKIESELFKEGFSFTDKCGVDKIKKVMIEIPVIDSEDKFDLNGQKQLAEKHKRVEGIISTVIEELENIDNAKPEFVQP